MIGKKTEKWIKSIIGKSKEEPGFIIMNNDSPEAIVIGSYDLAIRVMENLKRIHRHRYATMYYTIGQYEDHYSWHTRELPVIRTV